MADIELVIKIPEEYYNYIKNISAYHCTGDMLIIKNGTPLPEILDDIKAEIESKYESIPDTFHHYETGFTDALEWVLSVIDKHKTEEGKA